MTYLRYFFLYWETNCLYLETISTEGLADRQLRKGKTNQPVVGSCWMSTIAQWSKQNKNPSIPSDVGPIKAVLTKLKEVKYPKLKQNNLGSLGAWFRFQIKIIITKKNLAFWCHITVTGASIISLPCLVLDSLLHSLIPPWPQPWPQDTASPPADKPLHASGVIFPC